MDESLPDLSRPRRIHIVGAAGSGMSAIASVLAGMGHTVTGSDAAGGPALKWLEGRGVSVSVGHEVAAVGAAEMLAVSTAVPADDPEVVEAGRLGKPVWRRSDILAAICARRRTIAVSGSHGKTTTSSMLAVLLEHAGVHPSMIVGGDIAGVGPGAAWDPAGEWMVVEADESDGTFVRIGAEAVVVTSVSSDHAEFYGGRAGLDGAFRRFVSQAPGPAVVCVDDPGSAALASASERELVTYGTSPDAHVRVDGVELGGSSAAFRVASHGTDRGSVRLQVPGLHNVLNATAALAAATEAGVPWGQAVAGVESYRGVGRRFERRGEHDGVTFVDDYAHNPEKVAAALATARDGSWRRVVAVFQPHRYSRTEALWREFGPALAGADVLVVTGIYPAGEAPRPGISGEMVADAARASNPGQDVRYAETLDQAAALLRDELRSGDLCLTMGAGDVTGLAGRFVEGPR